MTTALLEKAPAKVNLSLRIGNRRPDGYHELESLVVFAQVADALSFTPARVLALSVRGPTAAAAGEIADNLVLKAAHALADRVAGLKLGRFALSKRLPVAAGLGGGSSDAAAALRLLARANRLARNDSRVMQAARAVGADVPVCLDPRPRLMRGIGDILSDPIRLPRLPAVLANPGVAVATKDVFGLLHRTCRSAPTASPLSSVECAARAGHAAFLAQLAMDRNDLEAPAIALQPAIAGVLMALSHSQDCRVARMSGSGATCFGLFASARAAAAAARRLRSQHSSWWIRATALGGSA